jgi:hypothetical protein
MHLDHAHTPHFERLAGLEHVDILATEHPLDGAAPVCYMGRDQLDVQLADRIVEGLVKFTQLSASFLLSPNATSS